MKLCAVFLYDDTPINPIQESPIIVIGMHRSGTSLVTRLLEDVNVSMGKRQGEKTSEDLFFRRRNELLFGLAHASWDNPSSLSSILESARWRKALGKVIRDDLSKSRHLPLNPFSLKHGHNHSWGFKDPRNTFTLPVWLDIFPNAKVIHVVRNGHAVSSSLLQRGERSLKKNKIPSMVSLNPSLSLDLWAEYVMTARVHCASLPSNQVIEIKYENLLESPKEMLQSLTKFLCIDVSDKKIKKTASRVKHPQNPLIHVNSISPKAQKTLSLYNY